MTTSARRASVRLLLPLLAACGASSGTDAGGGGGAVPAAGHHVQGTVSGLSGSGLVLQLNGAEALPVAAGTTAFRFTTPVAGGSVYHVAVSAQPAGPTQACAVTGGDGTMGSADVTGVAVACATPPGVITLGGTVTGLAGTGLTLRLDATTTATVPPGATTFTFPGELAAGTTYAVTVDQNPHQPWQTCTVENGRGTATAPVTSVAVTCRTNAYAVRGTVSGLAGTGLALQINGGTPVAIPAGATTFSFPAMPSMTSYTLAVASQPTSPPQTCAVATAGGSSVAASGATGQVTYSDITNALVTCAGTGPAVGGWVTGLTKGGLVLELNGAESLPVAANAASFRFATGLATGAPYGVTIVGQPAGQPCILQYAKGVKSDAEVASIAVRCETIAADPLTGVYARLSPASGAVRGHLALWADGTFTYASHDDTTSCPSRGNGVEYGFYAYSAATGAFRFQDAPTDSNGSCGLLHGGGANLGGTLTRVGNDLQIFVPLTGVTHVFTAVPSVPGTLTGGFTWALGPTSGRDGSIAIFRPDGVYVVANAQQGLTVGTVVGYELACYQATPSTITADLGASCTPDGLPVVETSDGAFTSGVPVPYVVTGPDTVVVGGTTTLTRIP